MSEEDIYLAGFFDSRGFLKFDKEHCCYAVFFNISEQKLLLLKEVKTMIGFGKIYGVRPKIKGRQKEYSLWIGGKDKSLAFLRRILPYSKRSNEIMEFIEKVRKTKRW